MSVLVDHTLRWDGAKRIVEPPAAEKLKVIRDLVTAAAGLDANRGDQLAVEAFPFESTLTAEPLTVAAPAAPASPLPPWLQKLLAQKNITMIAGIGAGAMAALVVGFAMVARKRGRKNFAAASAAEALEAAKAKELLAPEHAQRQLEARMAEQQALQEAEALMALKAPVVSTRKTEVLVKHISAEAKKDPTAMAHVVRSWLNGENQR
jgi:flagellar M-ring protein FliF